MKNRVWLLLLGLSLATNIWLLSGKFRATTPSLPTAPASSQPNAAAPAATRTTTAASEGAVAAASLAVSPQTLEMMRTARSDDEIRKLVSDLRGAGVPGGLIRAWVTELLKARFADKEPSQPFWRRHTPTPEFVAATQALAAERQALLENLLGSDASPAATLSAPQREQRYGKLSDDKLNAVARIEREYDEMRAKTSPNAETNIHARINAEVDQQRLLEEEKFRDLAAILSPEELEQYSLRNSRTAQALMRSLGGLDVTAEEYAALHRLLQALDQSHPVRFNTASDLDALAARMKAADEANQKARDILPDDRYYKYLESVDFNYANVARFAAAYPQISRETAFKVHRLQIELQDALRHARRPGNQQSGKAPQPDIKAYDARLVELLGPEIAAAYKKQVSGRIFISTPGGG